MITNYSSNRGQPTRYEDVYCLRCAQSWLRRRPLAADLQRMAALALEEKP